MTVLSSIVARLAKLPPRRHPNVTVEREVAIPMPDGVDLLADRWYPVGPDLGTAPLVLLRSPYGRRELSLAGRLFAERGYQVVIQSCRGTFGSGGDWEPFRHERADGQATLAWLADQPWFPGRMGMFGPSYLGLSQWAVADGAPDHLSALAPAIAPSSMRESVVYQHDVFALDTVVTWMHQVAHQELPPWRVLAALAAQRRAVRRAFRSLPLADADRRALGRRVDWFQDWLAHEAADDPYWAACDFTPWRDHAPPASMVTGWFDIFLPWQVRDFRALSEAGQEARLTIGPWGHVSLGGSAATLRDAIDWFDVHLRRSARSARPTPVRVFVMGSKRWLDLPSWPPPVETRRWYLHGGGALVPETPRGSAPSAFRYDPSDPTPSVGGTGLDWRSAGRRNQAKRERRHDVLVFTSEALTTEVTLVGPPTADLHVRSSNPHADVFVSLCAVSRRGRSTNVSHGIVRLDPQGREEGDAAANDARRVRVEMWPTAITFRRGERIRVQVSAGAHPLFARNLGNGEPIAKAMTTRPSEHEVLHDPARPSCVELPVSTV